MSAVFLADGIFVVLQTILNLESKPEPFFETESSGHRKRSMGWNLILDFQ